MSHEDEKQYFQDLWERLELEPLEGQVSPGETLQEPAPTDTKTPSLNTTSLRQSWQQAHLSLAELPPLRIATAQESEAAGSIDADLWLVGELGEGGMAQVHLAQQRALRREVALKRVRPDMDNERRAHHLLKEGLITGALEHPNIVPVYLLGRDANHKPVLVMRRVEGMLWETLLHQPDHPFWKSRKTWTDDPLIRNIEILMELCNALHFAHSRGVLHRDIKPENVMLGEFGEVYILDWGIATPLPTATDAPADPSPSSSVSGTPAFMAPEMLTRDPSQLDERTDVYLLGATLHYILTGHYRHQGDSLYETLYSVVASEPFAYHDATPRELVRLCNQATHKDKDRRPPSALAFREALVDYLSHCNSIAMSQTAQERLHQLRVLLPQAQQATTPHLPQLVRRLFTECRFGFLQAQQMWPHNPDARAGLQEALERMTAYELTAGNVDAAAALLAELPTPSEALTDQLRERIQARRKEEAETARLQQIARDLDITVGLGQRIRLLLILSVFVGLFAVGTLALIRTGRLTLTYNLLLGIILASLALMGAIFVRWRDPLLTHKANRNFSLLLVLGISGMFLSRVAGAWFGLPIAYELVFEFILFALILGAAGLLFHPSFWWGTPVCLTGVLVGLLAPSWIFEIMVLLTVFMWIFPIVTFWRLSRNTLEK